MSSMWVFFCLGEVTVYNFLRREFSAGIDFWSARVIKRLILNLNFYLLTYL